VQFAHSLGEIVTAAVTAGLRIVRLDEHLEGPVPIAGAGGTPDPGGRYRFHITGQPMRVFYTLIAERPASRRRTASPGSPAGPRHSSTAPATNRWSSSRCRSGTR
jgi:hypothetical protein